MTEIVVIIPVLNRPERVEPLLASLAASERAAKLRPLFVCSPGDEREIEAVSASDADWMLLPIGRGPGDYARKINRAAYHAQTMAEWLFLGADDLCFCPGWADIALQAAIADFIEVVGTNDLGNPAVISGAQSTHSLVRSSYLERGTIDERGKLLHEGYEHNWVDNEFVATARSRGVYIFAANAHVEHLHPSWGKGQADSTYELGMRHYHQDAQLFRAREKLWL